MNKLFLTLALTATHYLFVYFTGNAPEKEQICYAVSNDHKTLGYTHFNPYGAWEVAKMIVMGLKQLNSPLVDHLRSDWQDFAPPTPRRPATVCVAHVRLEQSAEARRQLICERNSY